MPDASALIIKMRIFDVAEEIDLQLVEKALKLRGHDTEELIYRRLTPKYMKYEVAPMLVNLKDREFEFGGKKLKCARHIKVFAFGVMSMHYEFEFEGGMELLNTVSIAIEKDGAWRNESAKEIEKIIMRIGKAVKPHLQRRFF